MLSQAHTLCLTLTEAFSPLNVLLVIPTRLRSWNEQAPRVPEFPGKVAFGAAFPTVNRSPRVTTATPGCALPCSRSPRGLED
jgi:hypothetical protein